MIQRIQSVYLLATSLLGILTYIVPFFTLQNDGDVQSLSMFTQMANYIYALPVLAGLISLGTIFLYNNRKIQLKLCWTIIFLLLISIAQVAVIHIKLSGAEAVDLGYQIAYGGLLPIAMLLFTFLAKGSINKDEKLVKSLDRLR